MHLLRLADTYGTPLFFYHVPGDWHGHVQSISNDRAGIEVRITDAAQSEASMSLSDTQGKGLGWELDVGTGPLSHSLLVQNAKAIIDDVCGGDWTTGLTNPVLFGSSGARERECVVYWYSI